MTTHTAHADSLKGQLNKQKKLDAIFVLATKFFALLVLLSLGGILASLVIGAIPSMQAFGLGFYTSSEWNPVSGEYGALAPIYGTLVTSFIAILIAVPVSFGIAVFLTELCPKMLKKPLGIAIELLAGVPSIIYGMWGLFVFAPWFGDKVQPWLIEHLGGLPVVGTLFNGAPMGIGLFTASLVLAIMIIPFIAATMRDVFAVVPDLLKESAYGVGATTWEVMTKIVLPYTKAGVVGGVILGLGRALGETMAVTFLIGNTFNITPSMFASGVSITSALANEFAEASSELHLSSLLHLGLILFVITFIVLSISKIMLMKIDKKAGK
ncbi:MULTISPECIES: phosphate ABC transporter permease subunit PstC [Moraxella]|uniref:Phosphate transport system permease protein n=1 Tax=Moraxella lacunata TaxID=477 RepID=A0A1B8PZ20_MORLA|nr:MULTISPECIES: phosphate ABC transporter permease subunit PstC [Moraxella]MBE9579054.1 phosphate ABC transporter permease subunit PstC [Moraxella sp. K1664]MBE9588911.1 phosphate ABC transporter permease subunit PstC [Moraxella sp. K1630]MBE9590728.1 phosphate ABC transporter permease subunit PstC [Moraxella sp. K127]MBE9596553.1 phosphate ABC transporter permease subunit PstC [Moraxella sp. K2450]MDH9218983.1 phosphate ABC transporter permease subunit PstC [Moraxella lacunata]